MKINPNVSISNIAEMMGAVDRDINKHLSAKRREAMMSAFAGNQVAVAKPSENKRHKLSL